MGGGSKHTMEDQNNSKNPFAYVTFKKAFANAIAGVPNLTDAQKFIYLKSFVRGEALNIIECIPVDNKGYSSAFEKLDFNFLNQDEIIDRTLDALLALNEAKSLRHRNSN